MSNRISITLEFYFKGQKHSPTMVLDLNAHIMANSGLDSLYVLLANSNNIDLYSYEYEMMLVEDMIFSDATGLAASFLENGKFDFDAFRQALYEEGIDEIIEKIASDYLSIDDLSLQPDIKAALAAAYKLGQQ